MKIIMQSGRNENVAARRNFPKSCKAIGMKIGSLNEISVKIMSTFTPNGC